MTAKLERRNGNGYDFINVSGIKTVTEQGSFRKAAELLGLTPSAISHAVASLEGELGFPVLNRSKSGVTIDRLWGAAAPLC